MENKEYPQYVLMNGQLGLRLICDCNNHYEYHLDAGNWSVDFKLWNNGSLTSISPINSVNGCNLTPTTREKWEKLNIEYAIEHKIFGYLINENNVTEITDRKYLLIR